MKLSRLIGASGIRVARFHDLFLQPGLQLCILSEALGDR